MIPNWKAQQDVEIEEVIVTDESLQEPSVLIIYDDPITKFEAVIEMLMKYCGHSAMQAEQCATIAHYKGKCDVKRGTVKELRPILYAFLDNKLGATIE